MEALGNTRNELSAKQAAEVVKTRWDNFVRDTNVYRKKLTKWANQYRGVPQRRNYDGLANVFIKETLQAVESIVAQEYNILYSESKPLYVKGREETDDLKARLIEGMTIAALDEMGAQSKILNQLRQKVKYGTTVAEICWRYDDRDVIQRDAVTKGEKFISKVLYDNPDLRYLDLLDVAFDPGKSCVRDMDWVIIRDRCTWDDLKSLEMKVRIINGQPQMRGIYANLDQVKALGKSRSNSSSDLEKKKRFQSMGIHYEDLDENEYVKYKMYGKVPMWWVDDNIPVDSDDAERMVQAVVEVVNGEATIRLHRNPYYHQEIPVLLAQFIQVDNEAYGIGVCEILEDLQIELNDKRNQLLDHASFQIFPPLIKYAAAGIKNESIQLKPSKIITSNVLPEQAIRPLSIGGNPQEILASDSVIKQDMRNESGANNPVQGISSPGNQTAFEINVLEKRGASRINVSVADFGEKFLKPMYRFIYKLLGQYVTTDRAVSTLGEDGIRWHKVQPQDLVLDLDFIPKISTDGDSRIMVRNQLIQFMQGIAKYYPDTKIYRLVRKIYTLFGFDDVDEVVPLPDTELGKNDLSTDEEMKVLLMGQKIPVKFYEDHTAKADAAMRIFQAAGGQMSPAVQEAFQDYIQQHLHYLKVLEMAQKTMAAQMGQPAKPGAQGPANNIPNVGVTKTPLQTANIGGA